MIYFASDIHLGLQYKELKPKQREQIFVDWLNFIEPTCDELFLVGDVFDFWFEFSKVVPKGFIRSLSKLAQMVESGIKIHFFGGNHDMWNHTNYLNEELGLLLYNKPTQFTLQGKRVMITHGDGLNNTPMSKFLTAFFRSKFVVFVFQRVMHPDLSVKIGQNWSNSSRHSRSDVKHEFRGTEEPVVKWAIDQKSIDPNIDYFIFGHLHTPAQVDINNAQVVILGEWISSPEPTYATMNDGVITLHQFHK